MKLGYHLGPLKTGETLQNVSASETGMFCS